MSGVTTNGIRYPDGASKAKNLGPELKTMAEDIDGYIDTAFDATSPLFQTEAKEAVDNALEEALASFDLFDVVDAPINPLAGIICFGDSLTYGQGSGGVETNSFPAQLATELAVGVLNAGIPAESSSEIAGRQGGAPLLARPTSGALLGTGRTPLTIRRASDGQTVDNLARLAFRYFNPVKLAGRMGSIDYDTATSTWGFTPITPGGTNLTIRNPAPIYPMSARRFRGLTQIAWVGTNNILETDQIVGDIEAMEQHVWSLDARMLSIGPFNREGQIPGTAAHTALLATERQLALTRGRRHINARRYLIDYGLADAGITPTAQDQADIANDLVPTSLRNDNVHLNQTGYRMVALLVAARLRELGWAPQKVVSRHISLFDGAAGTTLAAYTPDSGPGWTHGIGLTAATLNGSGRLNTPACTPLVNVQAESGTVEADIVTPAVGGGWPSLGLVMNVNPTYTYQLAFTMTETTLSLVIIRPTADGGSVTLATTPNPAGRNDTATWRLTRDRDRVRVSRAGTVYLETRLSQEQEGMLIGNTLAGIRVNGSTLSAPAFLRWQFWELNGGEL